MASLLEDSGIDSDQPKAFNLNKFHQDESYSFTIPNHTIENSIHTSNSSFKRQDLIKTKSERINQSNHKLEQNFKISRFIKTKTSSNSNSYLSKNRGFGIVDEQTVTDTQPLVLVDIDDSEDEYFVNSHMPYDNSRLLNKEGYHLNQLPDDADLDLIPPKTISRPCCKLCCTIQ